MTALRCGVFCARVPPTGDPLRRLRAPMGQPCQFSQGGPRHFTSPREEGERVGEVSGASLWLCRPSEGGSRPGRRERGGPKKAEDQIADLQKQLLTEQGKTGY